MKEKIIEIIGFGMEPERAELKASQIIILFNQRILDTLKASKSKGYAVDGYDIIDEIFIKL